MHWEWRGMAVKICIGGHHFWKIMFLLMGQENTQKLVPIPLFTYVFLFLTQLELDGHFPSHFSAFPLVYPWMETCFCIAKWMAKEIHNLGVSRGNFFPCNPQELVFNSNFLSL